MVKFGDSARSPLNGLGFLGFRGIIGMVLLACWSGARRAHPTPSPRTSWRTLESIRPNGDLGFRA